ncbi:MAG: hypothetical protein K9M82_12065 [Deltaproteobacteria bacterium]|nr:hypothetical protein [Deltaproteobacteria bacterium]
MEPFSLDIHKYLGIARRRVYWIVIPFLLAILGGMVSVLRAVHVYEAQTLILVQPQEVPQSYVRPIVQRGLGERLRTITQQVTSRTNLEAIIDRYELYRGGEMMLEEKVNRCRSSISVNVGRGGGGGNTFEITFRHTDPEKAKDVTNALASNFISENLKIRESQALGTSSFLADELASVRRKLEQKEETLKQYSMAHMGAMPDQLGTNLSMLERMQRQVEQLNDSLQDAENRKLMIQEQMAQQKRMADQMAQFTTAESLLASDDAMLSGDASEPVSEDLAVLRDQLERLKIRYTEFHPDVRRIKSMIEKLEAREAEQAEQAIQEPEPLLEAASLMPASHAGPLTPSAGDMLRPQLSRINYEIQDIRREIAKTREKIDLYQSRVEETPRLEQELITLKRDYNNLKGLHDSLLNRKLEAEIAVSMEKKQKGEQFRILDPARRPEIPVEPDIRRVFLLTIILGLGIGGGLAYGKEILDSSLKTPEEVSESLGLPVLITLPLCFTGQEKRARRWKARLKAAGVAVGFAVTAVGIVLVLKGLDGTLQYVKGLLPFV